MEGGTTFHFIDASPAEALETAREAAGGQDVRLGGGATIIRDFLAAGLVDYAHIVVVPLLLGRGARLWDGLEGLEKDYEIEATSAPSGVTHVTLRPCGRLNRLLGPVPRARVGPGRPRGIPARGPKRASTVFEWITGGGTSRLGVVRCGRGALAGRDGRGLPALLPDPVRLLRGRRCC